MKLLKKILFFTIFATTAQAQGMGEFKPYHKMDREAVQEEFERAIRVGDLDAVKVLLVLGAHPNGLDSASHGRPLSRAIRRMDSPIVEFLLEAGAEVHVCHVVSLKKSPFFIELSQEQDFIRIFELLREYDTEGNFDKTVAEGECRPSTTFSFMRYEYQRNYYTGEN